MSEPYEGGWKPGDFAIYSDFGMRSLMIVRVLPADVAPPPQHVGGHGVFFTRTYDAGGDLILAAIVDNSLKDWDFSWGPDPRPWNAVGAIHTFNEGNLYHSLEELIKKQSWGNQDVVRRIVSGLHAPERFSVFLRYGLAKPTTVPKAFEWNPAKEWHEKREAEARLKSGNIGNMWPPSGPTVDDLNLSYWTGRHTTELHGVHDTRPDLEMHTNDFRFAREQYSSSVARTNRRFPGHSDASSDMYWRGRVDGEIDALRELGMTNDEIAQLNPRRRNPDEDIRALQARVNALVDERRRYGVRKVTTGGAGIVLGWSNSGYWITGGHVYPAGTVLELDANEIFVANANAEDLEFLAEGKLKYLKPLPLWGGSFERMGSPDYSGIELPPMIRHIRDMELFRTPEVDEALKRKAEESNPTGVKIRKIGQYHDGRKVVRVWLMSRR